MAALDKVVRPELATIPVPERVPPFKLRVVEPRLNVAPEATVVVPAVCVNPP